MSDIHNMIERRRLIRAFDKLKDYHIIAVSAPAGYGKTVAVMQWLNKDTRAKVIFSMDEYDNNLAGFCERFCAALQLCQPQNGTLADIISRASFSAPDEFALRAVSALSGRKQAVLAIDDLHLIHNNEVLQLLLVLIKRLPKNFQVVLISRNDLPLGFSDLWIKGQVARIGPEQLLFTDKDIMDLYQKRGSEITYEQAEDISQQTQGWAMGINALLLSDDEASGNVYGYLDDFVQLNIWDKWDEATRDFMLRTAALRELIPSLCNAMTGMAYSDRFLKELVQKGAFITPLPTGTYRYHHLFQQFLLHKARERGEVFMQSLLETEGYWHLSNKDFFNAIDCFIRCKNHDGIAQCFDLLEHADYEDFAMERLLSILKYAEVQDTAKNHPHLLYLFSYCALIEGRVDDMVFLMDEYYMRNPEIIANNPARVFDIHYMHMMDFRIPLSQVFRQMKMLDGKLNGAVPKWNVCMHMLLPHRGIRDFSEMAIGDAVENINANGWLYAENISLLNENIITGLLYEQGHLTQAYKHALMANAIITDKMVTDIKTCTMLALVMVLDASGELDEANAVLQSMSLMIENDKRHTFPRLKSLMPNNEMSDKWTHTASASKILDTEKYHINVFIARRKIASGDIKAAEEWLNANTFDSLTLWGIYAGFTTCRAFIATGKYDRAIVLLNKILILASQCNRPLDILEARILLSVAYWKKKHRFQKDAIAYLESAVLVAYPYGYVQMFVNDGAELAGMLHKLINRVKQQNKADDKLLSFTKMLYLKTRDKAKLNDAKIENTAKYTDKQMAVINLLCQGKTYKEMAEALGVKQTTLRSHLEAIYNKLDVTNMADAITKINEMGLLE